jgi:hypothetical protein
VRGGAVALPAPARRHGATGTFERVLRLPDHRMVDRLLRGRAWIWVLGILLGGIVTMQVSLLKLNTGISRAVESAGTLERQNSDLEASIARLSSSERTRTEAEANGLIMPPAGEVAYLTVRPDRDAARAAVHMRPPSDAARALMANDGIVPGSLAAPTATPTPAPSAAPTAAPTTAAPSGTSGTAANGTSGTAASGTSGTAANGTSGTAASGTSGTAANGTSGAAATAPSSTSGAAGGVAATGAAPSVTSGGAAATGTSGGTAPTTPQG